MFHDGRTAKGDPPMRGSAKPLLLMLCALFLLASCASTKAAREWKPGDTIICPHCGREFTVPEKLGK